MPEFIFPHIDISARAITRDYQAPQENMGGGAAPRIRSEHGVQLKAQLEAAFAQFEPRRTVDERLDPATGSYIEVELRRGEKVDGLEKKTPGIVPGAATVQANDNTRIALFVPDDARPILEQILADYTDSPLTRSAQPRYKSYVEPIEAIRQARLETFWTDEPQALPQNPQDEIWWEVWCFKNKHGSVSATAQRLNMRVSEQDRWLVFPETVVIPILATRAAIELLLFASVGVAELRRASASPTFFVDQEREAQLEWATNLAERTTWPNNDVVAVCLFDTGVNRAHALIEPALAAAHMGAVLRVWSSDDHEGHGTSMAGIALFGDLVEPLSDNREIILQHRLESVKVLPPNGFPPNDPASYGAITQSAVAIAEINRPEASRIFCMAVTNDDVSGARSSTWSAALDQSAAGKMDGDDEDAPKRLFVVSAGNAPPHIERARILDADEYPIEDPAQAWNVLTVGGYTDKIDITDAGYDDWKPFASAGQISPFTRTSTTWPNNKSPFKPEIVMEAGNRGISPADRDVLSLDSLALLTTGADEANSALVPFSATSAAAAQAARLAARLSALFPDYWPETIRALVVHSAEWTQPMRDAVQNAPNKRAACNLLRRFGYGVPNFDRAAASAANHLALVSQKTIRPYKSRGGRKFRDCHFYRLPWPTDVLEGLGEQDIQLKITLSYFIEPNPGRAAAIDPQSYQSFGLRFDLRRRLETIDTFVRRVNPLERDNPRDRIEAVADDGWTFGPQSISAGSLHCDVWQGPAVRLASRDTICIKPVMGWWRTRDSLAECDQTARYALVATLSSANAEIDLHTPVSTIVANEVNVEIEF